MNAVAIGNFDGFHIGHKSLIYFLKKEAKKRSLFPSIVTFKPHPASVILEKDIELINSYEEKRELINKFGIYNYKEYTFDIEFSKINAEDFIKEIIYKEMDSRLLIVGEEYRFGYKREGDINFAKKIGKEIGLEIISFGHIKSNDYKISSNSIRKYIKSGNINNANELLGHNFFINGYLKNGILEIPLFKILPKDGIYPIEIIEPYFYKCNAYIKGGNIAIDINSLNDKNICINFINDCIY